MRPQDLFALSWTLYRLQLSAAETPVAGWWAAMFVLWVPPRKVARRPGPSLAEMVRETRRDTFDSDDGGSA